MHLKRSILANYLGQGWVAVMALAFVPLYVKALGAESYGLIGIFAIMQAWLGLLDLGLTPTLNREMAQLGAKARTPDHVRDLLRSLEFIYLALALAMIAALCAATPWLVKAWLQVGTLPAETVIASLRLMTFVLAARWLEQIYRGALQGLEDQVWLNGTQAILATVRWGGAYVVVAFFSASVISFFIWQGLTSILTGTLLIQRTYSRIPKGSRTARFNIAALRDIRGFATGMFISAGLAFLLSQADKLVISKLLPLEQLGYYMIATAAASGLLQLVTPMNNAVFPRLNHLTSESLQADLARTYQQACEGMAAVLMPISLVLIIHSRATLLAWTADPVLAAAIAPMLTFLAIGTMLNGLANIPYMLQLAHGWTQLSIGINCVAVVVIVPLMLYLVPRYGAVGAAICWAGLNGASLLVGTLLMHRRLLPASKWVWYRTAFLLPLCAGCLACFALAAFLPVPQTRLQSIGVLAAALTVTIPAVAIALPLVRRQFVQRWSRPRKVASS